MILCIKISKMVKEEYVAAEMLEEEAEEGEEVATAIATDGPIFTVTCMATVHISGMSVRHLQRATIAM